MSSTSVGFGWGSVLDNAAGISSYSEHLASQIREGMSVYDDRNHRVGTVRKVYPPTRDHEFYIKVGTGLFGSDVCIPAHYLTVWNDQVGVGMSRNQIKRMGWSLCPSMIRES
jgi:hypothetical protein